MPHTLQNADRKHSIDIFPLIFLQFTEQNIQLNMHLVDVLNFIMIESNVLGSQQEANRIKLQLEIRK
jgi:hypothetical protein